MNSRQGGTPPGSRQLSVIPPNVVVTPEDYAQNLARIQAARAYLATYEAQNEAGLQRFVSQEQELVQRIEAGREAERILAEFQSARGIGQISSPTATEPSVNPAASSLGANYYHPNVYNEAPLQSSARIIELPSSEQSIGEHSRNKPNYRSSRHLSHQQQNYAEALAFAQSAYQQHHPQEPLVPQNWQPYSQNHVQSQSSNGHPVTFGGVGYGIMAPPPISHQQHPRQHAMGVQSSTVAGPYNAYSQDSALNTIQQYPTSTVTSKSTLDGALGAQTEEISHTKVTYSSQKSRAASTSLESSNKHGSTTSGVSNASEAYNKIFNIVKDLRPETVQYIIILVVDALKQQHGLGGVQDLDIARMQVRLPERTQQHLKVTCNYVINQLQALDTATIKQILFRVRANSQKAASASNTQSQSGQPLGLAGVNLSKSGPTLSHTGFQSALVTSRQPGSSHPLHSTPSTKPQTCSSLSAPSQYVASPSTALTIPSNNTQPQNAVHYVTAAQLMAGGTSLKLNHPSGNLDTTDKVMFCHFVPPPNGSQDTLPGGQAPSETVRPTTALPKQNMRSSSSNNTSSPARLTTRTPNSVGPPRTPPVGRSQTPWTPAKADKARLAQDIMRSLGRPTGATPPYSPRTQSVGESPAGKRRRTNSASESPSEVAKRHRSEVIKTGGEITTFGALEHDMLEQSPSVAEQRQGTYNDEAQTRRENGKMGVAGTSVPARGVDVPTLEPTGNGSVPMFDPLGAEPSITTPVRDTGKESEVASESVGELLSQIREDDFTGQSRRDQGGDSSASETGRIVDLLTSLPNTLETVGSEQSTPHKEPPMQLSEAENGAMASPSEDPPSVVGPIGLPAGPRLGLTPAPEVWTPEVAPAPVPVQDALTHDAIEPPISIDTAEPTVLSAVSPLNTVQLEDHRIEYEPTSPVQPGPSRIPLFFPSPSSSHGNDDDRVPDMQLDQTGVDTLGRSHVDSFPLDTSLLGPGSESSAIARDNGKDKWRAIWDDEDDRGIPPIRESATWTISRAASVSTTSVREEGKREVYVLVPPPPEWVKRMKMRIKMAKTRRAARIIDDESDIDELDGLKQNDEENELQRKEERLRQEAVRLSYSRMRESPCRWRGCSALLNSTAKLIKHVSTHAEDRQQPGPFVCEWQGCSRRFSKKSWLSNHLTRHASHPISCAYQNCERAFASSKELLHHHSSYRHRGQPLKRTPDPFEPVNTEPLPPLPLTLPSYMIIPRRIAQHPISKVVHNWLGAKVLENISSFHYSGRRLHAGAPSRSSRRLAEKIAVVEKGGDPARIQALLRRMMHDEYDTIARGRSLKSSERCDDIPSGDITRSCEDGLVLFPSVNDVREGSIEAEQGPDELDLIGALDEHPSRDDRGSEAEQLTLNIDEPVVSSSGVEESMAQLDIAEDSLMAIMGDDAILHQSRSDVLTGDTNVGAAQSQPGRTAALSREEDEEVVEMLL
ncbi:hypothetical protein AcV5_001432 [Taiwanofungus camphoratus]|nr:hypothetical protein AcW2_005944 [Antrodia cinnamomea]KAI0940283.1 hypothetical protein AcV5_001432 [Antrodia cinnamomea]